MRPFKDYETTQTITGSRQLPVGAYICTILKAEEKVYNTSKGGEWHKLEISFDIAEGENKGFYADNYRAQTGEDKKWKGVIKLNVPNDDGSEMDAWNKRSFKTNMQAIEESNNGYHWDWNEVQLKNKAVGIVFRSEEWEYNGKNGWHTAAFKFISVADVKSGNFKIPDPKPLKGKTLAPQPAVNASALPDMSDFEDIISDAPLPF